MLIDGILASFVGFMALALGRAVLFASAVDWRRDVTVTGLLLLLGILLGIWRLLPRYATRASRNLRQLIGPAVLVFGILLLLSAIYSTLGPHHDHGALPFFSAVYKAVQFFPLNGDPGDLRTRWNWGEWLVALFAVLLFLGVAIQGIVLLFHESLSNARLLLANRHVVICGVGRIGHQLVDDLVNIRNDGRTVVVIERDPEHPDLSWLREQGVVVITGAAQRADVLQKARVRRADEVFVVTGSDEINVECVVELRDQLRGCGRREPLRCHVHLRDRDLASGVRTLLNRAADKNEVPLDVEIFNSIERTVRRLFQDLVVSPERLPAKQGEVAHAVIIGFDEFGQGLAESLATLGHFPNLARLRMTIIDHDLDAKAKAFLARYPRFTRRHPDAPKGKVVVPWWDLSDSTVADQSRDQWDYGSDPGIDHVCNADFLDLGDVDEEVLVRKLAERFKPVGVKPLVFVCFDADQVNFKYAERIAGLRNRLDPQEFPARSTAGGASGPERWPVFVWIPNQRELSEMLSRDSSAPRPFGACFGAVSFGEITASWVDELARFLKFGYTARFPDKGLVKDRVQNEWRSCAETVKGLPFSGGITSGVRPWHCHEDAARHWWNEEKSEAFRTSDRAAAIHAVVKLACLGFKIDPENGGGSRALHDMTAAAKEVIGIGSPADESTCDPDADANRVASADLEKLTVLPRMEHYRWCAERLMAGWRYAPLPAAGPDQGNRKNSLKEQFRHWDLVPFDRLPEGEKGKDNYSVQVLLALAAHAEGLLKVAPLNGRTPPAPVPAVASPAVAAGEALPNGESPSQPSPPPANPTP